MKLSVVIITYNHERFIGKAIQSVLDQRVNFDYEIVIGEDCSTDSTREIVMDFQRRYPERIRAIVRRGNVGGNQNMTEVLAACQGEYVALLEGDDYWTRDDKLQRQANFLDAHLDCAICCARVLVVDEIDAGLPRVLPKNTAGFYTLEDLLIENFVWACTTVYRSNCIGPLPEWFRTAYPGDWARSALILRERKIGLMDETMAAYRVHAGGLWSSHSRLNRVKDTMGILTALNREFGFRYAGTINKTLKDYHVEWARIARGDNNRLEAGKCLVSWLRNGGGKDREFRPILKGLFWYSLFGSWHPVLARAKRAMLG